MLNLNYFLGGAARVLSAAQIESSRKIKRFIALFSLLVITSNANGALIFQNNDLVSQTGMNVGDTFQVFFVSKSLTPALSPDASFYDSIIQAEADAAGFGDITWNAVVATENSPLAELNAPQTANIVLTDGTFFRSLGDLFSWDNPSSALPLDINGDELLEDIKVWTGINSYTKTGATLPSISALGGSGNPYQGQYWTASGPELYGISRLDPASSERRLYGLSQAVTVVASVPEPTSVTLLSLGLLLAIGLRRNKKGKI